MTQPSWEIRQGDCLALLREVADEAVRQEVEGG